MNHIVLLDSGSALLRLPGTHESTSTKVSKKSTYSAHNPESLYNKVNFTSLLVAKKALSGSTINKVMASFSSSHFQLTSTQTAVALVVPHHLQSEINSLRRIHDKAFQKWEPHINILYPFVEPTRLSSAVEILREALGERHMKGLRVNIDEIGVFKHRKNATVFLKPDAESEERVCQLRKILVHALERDERDGTHDGTFRPHLTVGQAASNGNSIENLVEQVKKLVGIGWEGTTLAVLKREHSGEMKLVGELPLGNFESANNDGEHSCCCFNARRNRILELQTFEKDLKS